MDTVHSYLITDVLVAFDTAFGKTESNYKQWAEQRKNMRKGTIETVANYIKRYEDIHSRIQFALDSVHTDYRDSLRYM